MAFKIDPDHVPEPPKLRPGSGIRIKTGDDRNEPMEPLPGPYYSSRTPEGELTQRGAEEQRRVQERDRQRPQVTVGLNSNNPMIISQRIFEQIEQQSPGLADTLKRQGVDAYLDAIRNENERRKAKNEIARAVYEAKKEEYERRGPTSAVAFEAYRAEQSAKRITPPSKLDKFIKEDKLNVIDAIEAGYTDIKDYQGFNINANELQTLINTRSQYDQDLKTLSKYRKGSGNYSLADILVSDDQEAIAAATRVFRPIDISMTQRWIDENWGLKDYGWNIPGREIAKFYRKVTPWHEEKGETVWTGIESLKAKAGITPSKAATASAMLVATGETPIPYDDLIAILGTAGIIGFSAAENAIKGNSVPEVNKIQGVWGSKPIPLNAVYLVGSDGKVYPASSLASQVDFGEGSEVKAGYILNIPPALNKKQINDLTPPTLEIKPMVNVPVDLKAEPLITTPANVFDKDSGMLIFKKVSPTDIDSEYGLLTAQAKVAVAEKELQIKTNPILDRLAKEKATREAFTELNRAIRDFNASSLNTAMNRYRRNIPQELYEQYAAAHREYLAKKAAYEAAKKQYIESLKPQPVRGNIGQAQINQAVLVYLASKLKLRMPKAGESIDEYLESLTKKDIQRLAAYYNSVYTDSMNKGLTSSQAQTKANQALETKVLQAVQTATQTLTVPRTRTSTKTKTKVQEAVREATRPAVATTAAVAAPATIAAPIKPLKLPKGGKKDKEWTPSEVKSAIAWRDGIVVHAIKSPYRRGIDEKSFNVKKLPQGLVVMRQYKGKGSQQLSAKTTGPFPQRLTVDVGNVDAIFTKAGQRVNLRFRPGRGTASQTTIKKGRNISKKRGRIYHTRAAGGTILSRRGLRGY